MGELYEKGPDKHGAPGLTVAGFEPAASPLRKGCSIH